LSPILRLYTPVDVGDLRIEQKKWPARMSPRENTTAVVPDDLLVMEEANA
jgi:hypothetical protein